MPEWTFLTNHTLVQIYTAHHPRITAGELANAACITERTTGKIIADLLENGHIAKKREGWRNRYHVNPDRALRHPIYGETAVGVLFKVLCWKKPRRTA